jgi:glycerol transport system ATP-binding protein
MAEITLKGLAHSYEKTPKGAADYAIRQMDHVWHQGGAYAYWALQVAVNRPF